MKNNESGMMIALLRDEHDEKKVETRITIDILIDLRRLNLLLSDLEFKDAKWTGDFRFIYQLVKDIISFLPGESIIQFGFSCRVLFNLSSQYLKTDLKKLATCRFKRPLFDSDEILQRAENVERIKKLKISHLREKIKNLEKNFERICKYSICFGGTSILGFGVIGALFIADSLFSLSTTDKENSVMLECMTAFISGALFSCIVPCFGLCITSYMGDRLNYRKQLIESKYDGLQNLIADLRKWQNKDLDDNTCKLLDNRSCFR